MNPSATVRSQSKGSGYKTGVFEFSCDLQDFLEWRDPDSNRGHHDFLLGKTRSPLFLSAQESA